MRIARDGPLNQTQLAALSKIGNSTLGMYIQGKRKLPIWVARRLENAMGVPAAFLMGLIDEEDIELLRLPRAARTALLQLHASVSTAANKSPPAPSAPFEANQPHGVRRNARGP